MALRPSLPILRAPRIGLQSQRMDGSGLPTDLVLKFERDLSGVCSISCIFDVDFGYTKEIGASLRPHARARLRLDPVSHDKPETTFSESDLFNLTDLINFPYASN